MNEKEYKELYVEMYNKILQITFLTKEFLFPSEYEVNLLDDDISLDEKIEYIENELQSAMFEKEMDETLFDELEYYFPGNVECDSESYEMLKEVKEKVDKIYTDLKNKYLPFLKSVTISDNKVYNFNLLDEEKLWNIILEDDSNVVALENKIASVIWGIIDSTGEDFIDSMFKESYQMNDLEYKRYTNGKEIGSLSIGKRDINKSKNSKKIICDFSNFDECFKDIIGQDKAIKQIEKVLKRNILFYNAEDIKEVYNKRKNGPLATFMFYGATGTGKTECAKLLSDFIYGDESKLLILDMNSYKDPKIAASAIKGHPEGYVDSNKGTDFTRFLTNNKKGIIVLDEFEKSADEVREIFMTMLDEGVFKDSLGNVYDLSSYIFIATTNASEKFDKKENTIGFVQEEKIIKDKKEEDAIKEGLRNIFTAPIMNRFNNLIHFKKIQYDDAINICKSLIGKMSAKFENKIFSGITPSIKINNIDEICKIILKECDYEKDGVRSLKNVVNDIIGSQIIEHILSGNNNILIDCNQGKIEVKCLLKPSRK